MGTAPMGTEMAEAATEQEGPTTTLVRPDRLAYPAVQPGHWNRISTFIPEPVSVPAETLPVFTSSIQTSWRDEAFQK